MNFNLYRLPLLSPLYALQFDSLSHKPACLFIKYNILIQDTKDKLYI